jgi:hypothetical protein
MSISTSSMPGIASMESHTHPTCSQRFNQLVAPEQAVAALLVDVQPPASGDDEWLLVKTFYQVAGRWSP